MQIYKNSYNIKIDKHILETFGNDAHKVAYINDDIPSLAALWAHAGWGILVSKLLIGTRLFLSDFSLLMHYHFHC